MFDMGRPNPKHRKKSFIPSNAISCRTIRSSPKDDYKRFSPNILVKSDKIETILYDCNHIEIVRVDTNNLLDLSADMSVSFENYNQQFKDNAIWIELLQSVIYSYIIMRHAKVVLNYVPISQNTLNLLFLNGEFDDLVKIEKTEIENDLMIKEITLVIQNPDNTHYVQQAYLRLFSSNTLEWKGMSPKGADKKNKAKIFMYDLINGNGNEKRIETVACIDGFYSAHMEQMLRKFEKWTIPIFRRIIENKNIAQLTNSERMIIGDYIILQWLRTPESRSITKEMIEKIYLAGAKLYSKKAIPESVVCQVDDESVRIWCEQQMMDWIDPKSDANLVYPMLKRKWSIIQCKPTEFFLTSDTPVVFLNSYYEKNRCELEKNHEKKLEYIATLDHNGKKPTGSIYTHVPNLGKVIKSDGVEIYLPLCPSIALSVIDWKKETRVASVKQINEELTKTAEQFVFSHQSDFGAVQDFVKKHPDQLKDKTVRCNVDLQKK